MVETKGDLQLYADYPSSDAATQELLHSLSSAGTRVEVNPQSGKETRVIVIQFLIPILLLVCLFSFFMRQVADDIFDHDHRARRGIKLAQCVCDHGGVQMAASTGINLHDS